MNRTDSSAAKLHAEHESLNAEYRVLNEEFHRLPFNDLAAQWAHVARLRDYIARLHAHLEEMRHLAGDDSERS